MMGTKVLNYPPFGVNFRYFQYDVSNSTTNPMLSLLYVPIIILYLSRKDVGFYYPSGTKGLLRGIDYGCL